MAGNSTADTELHPGTPSSDFNDLAFLITMVATALSLVLLLLLGNTFDKWVQHMKEKLRLGKKAYTISPMAMKKRLGLHLNRRVEASEELRTELWVELWVSIGSLTIETLDFCAKVKFYLLVLDARGISGTFIACYSCLIWASSSGLFYVGKERLKIIHDTRIDLNKGCTVDEVPKCGFVSGTDFEVKAVRLCREVSIAKHAVYMSLLQDIIPLPINLWFMSINNWGREEHCTNPFDSNTFKLCMGSIIVTCMLIGFKLQLIPSLHGKLIEMERMVALARLKRQRSASRKEKNSTSSSSGRRGGSLATLHKVQVSPENVYRQARGEGLSRSEDEVPI